MSDLYYIQSAGETKRITETEREKAIGRAMEVSAATLMEVEVVRVVAVVRPPKVEVYEDSNSRGS